jgi:hypothetical protein
VTAPHGGYLYSARWETPTWPGNNGTAYATANCSVIDVTEPPAYVTHIDVDQDEVRADPRRAIPHAHPERRRTAIGLTDDQTAPE